MSWVLRALGVPTSLAAIILGGLVSGLLRGETAPVPSLTQATLAPVPVIAVLALIPAIATIWGWSGLPWQTSAVSARPIGVVLVALYVSAPLLYALASGLTGGYAAALENGRNAAGIIGLSIIGLRFLGERGAVLVPIAYLFASFLFGRGAGASSAHAWAWIINDAGNVVMLVIPLLLATVGVGLVPALPRNLVASGNS